MEIIFKNFIFLGSKNSLDVTLEENKIISVIGKNGSGKTLLMETLYGEYKKFSGSICVGNQKLTLKSKIKDIKEFRKKVAYIRQEYLNDLNCKKISDYLNIRLMSNNERLDNLIKLFGLKQEILLKSSLDLDEIEIKKIILIKQILRNTPILLLDDPTLGLDKKGIISLVKILKEEKRNGKIIIITSNDTEFLFTISDCFLIIDNDKIYEETDKYRLFSNKLLIAKLNLKVPNMLNFNMLAYRLKGVKLLYRDNVNDLLKEIYRNVETKK